MARIFVVDDHPAVVEWLTDELANEGYEVEGCATPAEAPSRILAGAFDLVVADVEMPGLRGLDLMSIVHRERPDQLVMLITAFGSIDLAVQALRAGACDFVTKPFAIETLVLAVEQALHDRRMRKEVVRVLRPSRSVATEGLVARSEAMRRVLDRAVRAARTRAPVLLTGETGVGKGTIARFLHARSDRRNAPFVQLNCAALPQALVEAELFGVRRGAFTDARSDREGLFDRARGGTILLDEIGELPLEAQPKLLLTLESGRVRPVGDARDHTVDVRVVAATNRPLEEAVRERLFRADLLYRLDVIRIDIPPLRERPDDVEGLVAALLDQLSARHGRSVTTVTEEAMRWLVAQPWPGNVRELSNVLERAVALGEHDALTLADVAEPRPTAADGPPESLDEAVATGLPLEDLQRTYMRKVLDACGGNMSEAARRLGVDRRTLYRWMAEP